MVLKQYLKNPDWFVAENVTGLESANSGKIFNIILKELEFAGEGYNITAHKYKFEEYCVPQKKTQDNCCRNKKRFKKIFFSAKANYIKK